MRVTSQMLKIFTLLIYDTMVWESLYFIIYVYICTFNMKSKFYIIIDFTSISQESVSLKEILIRSRLCTVMFNKDK